jgi:hypothetical protein
VRIRPRAFLQATALLAALAGCGRATGTASTAPGPEAPLRVLSLEQLFVLEMAGIPPEDTVVTLATGLARTVILRHGAPDNTTFVELHFDADAFDGPGRPDSITVTLQPRPGVYGVNVAFSTEPVRGASIRFKYPIHFSAPIAALGKYAGTARYEQALQVVRRMSGSGYGLLASDRPSSDNLRSALPGSGVYLVAAPR